MFYRSTVSILILLQLCGCKSQHWSHENIKSDTQLNTILSIDFQTGFKNDTLALWIGESNVLSETVASTVPEASFTSIRISLYKGLGNLIPNFIHQLKNGENTVKNSSITIREIIEIKIHIRPEEGQSITEKISLDLSKGKYIGILKSSSMHTIAIRQSETAFSYY
ncbi:hypothetical protein QWY85_15555 [Neolewinella lacunae]|uniref:Uncharacterized protein n=1 Tax=Neolewinella lacunae TaxID=1517758 RepID=A0A923T6X8_9BACT|nr:hypothetical protein [Neolewinella lacunae]MBC6993895.1 hypothetical protein [Neolewinella lacunae]MDN3636083.1 hypothetical protein [Neolewinella lacunae]